MEGPGYWNGSVRGREPARKMVDATNKRNKRGGKGCDAYADFRELLARKDIDSVEVCTPDHWHGYLVVAAARAGKDIYCQKPLALTISDGRIMSDVVKATKRVFQCGSQQRSDKRFRLACELARNGRIGKLQRVKGGSADGSSGLREDRQSQEA